MAGVKISNLSELLTTPPDTAILPIVSGGITQKVSIANIKTLIPPGSGAKGGAGNLVFWENPVSVTVSYSISAGANAGSFGPLVIDNGVTVTVPTGSTWSIV
jgi:hypothetical protein